MVGLHFAWRTPRTAHLPGPNLRSTALAVGLRARDAHGVSLSPSSAPSIGKVVRPKLLKSTTSLTQRDRATEKSIAHRDTDVMAKSSTRPITCKPSAGPFNNTYKLPSLTMKEAHWHRPCIGEEVLRNDCCAWLDHFFFWLCTARSWVLSSTASHRFSYSDLDFP